MTKLNRTNENPWSLTTPPGTSAYTMHADEKDGRSVLVCTVGKTVLFYDARCVDDLHAMLKAKSDWVELGGADEQKPAKDGTVEAWARSPSNPRRAAPIRLGLSRCAPSASIWSTCMP